MPLDGKFRANVLVQVKNGPLDFQPREPFSPAVRRDAAHAADARAADHQGVPRPGHAPRLPGHDVAGGAGRRHLREGPGLDRRPRRRRLAVRRTRRPGSPASPTSAPTATGAARSSTRRTGTPSAASPGIPALSAGGHRRRVDPDDLLERPGRRRAGDGDDARLARGRGELHDAARPRPPDGRGPPLRPRAVGRPAPGADWTPVYYNRADSAGLGFDRTADRQRRGAASTSRRSGSASPASTPCPSDTCSGSITCGWTARLRTGPDAVGGAAPALPDGDRHGPLDASAPGTRSRGRIDAERFDSVRAVPAASRRRRRGGGATPPSLYWQTFSHLPIPAGYAPPRHTLEFYEQLRCPADRTKPRCPAIEENP